MDILYEHSSIVYLMNQYNMSDTLCSKTVDILFGLMMLLLHSFLCKIGSLYLNILIKHLMAVCVNIVFFLLHASYVVMLDFGEFYAMCKALIFVS